MANKKTPNRLGQVRQLNKDDRSGELWATRGIDLSSNPSKIRKSNAVEIVAPDAILGSNDIQALTLFKNRVYALTDSETYNSSQPYNDFKEAINTGGVDMTVFGELLIIVDNNYNSGDANIDSWDGDNKQNNWWTDTIGGTVLDYNGAHNIITLRAQGKDTIAVTNGNSLKYYNTTAGHTSFSWDADLIGICQVGGLNEGWIGTYSKSNSKAEVVRWQIGRTEYTQSYPIDGSAVLAMATKLNIPYIIDEQFRIQKFVQTGFKTVAQLPLLEDNAISEGVETGQVQQNNLQRAVHPKGMWFDGEKLMVIVNTEHATVGNINERCPAGLYEVNVETGSVNHKADYAGEAEVRVSSPLLVLNDVNGRYYYAGRKKDGNRALFRQTASLSNGNANFILTEHHSESVRDSFSNLFMAAQQSDDVQVVVKKRQKNLPATYASIKWLDEKTFVTEDDISTVLKGYEVELMSGQGSGEHVHITDINKSETVYTVTLEDAVGATGSVSTAYIANWERTSKESTKEDIQNFSVGEISTKNQIKVFIKGTSLEVDRLIEVSHNKEELK